MELSPHLSLRLTNLSIVFLTMAVMEREITGTLFMAAPSSLQAYVQLVAEGGDDND